MTILNKKKVERETGFAIGVVLNKKETKGDVGIEVEIEGKNLPHNKMELNYKYWRYEHDHSLRGEENGEYVLKAPIPFKETSAAVDELWSSFEKCKSKLDDSNRTSVHVHLNCQKFHLNRLTAFFGLFYCLEEILTEWCGDHRVGNLFCLRAKDAPSVITQLRKFIQNDGHYDLRDTLHYAALNFHALVKYGSLEVRTLRGPTAVESAQQIKDWVRILQRIYDLSAEYTDPRELCYEFSAMGPIGFFEKVLGNTEAIVRAGVPWSDEQIMTSMMEGIRLAQDLCYCRDWGLYDGIEMASDPFGRSASKIAKKLAAIGGFSTAEVANMWQHEPVQYTVQPFPSAEFNPFANAPQAAPAHAPALNFPDDEAGDDEF